MATTIAGKDDIKLTVLGPDAAAKADGAATSTPPSPSRYAQWLRAAVLGASDGLVSTAALMLGISAARPADLHAVLLSGLAGLVAGACSMAIGEYVSVHAQLDVELAELRRAEAVDRASLDQSGDDLPSPVQAAAASALSFAGGAAVPLLAAWFIASYKVRVVVVVATATITLAAFGSVGAVLGGAPAGRAGVRAALGGLVAMGITYGLMNLCKVRPV
ncbi:hypothetical protein ACP70R_021966 [Stipagrostis hirtigluma subsp. patula]